MLGGVIILQDMLAQRVLTFNVGKLELIPWTLYNRKGDIISDNYRGLNLVDGLTDCLNHDLSKITYARSGKIIHLKASLSAVKLGKNKRDLFQIQEKSNRYIWSERLVKAICRNDATNLCFCEIPVDEQAEDINKDYEGNKL